MARVLPIPGDQFSDLIDFQTHRLTGLLKSLAGDGEFVQLPLDFPDDDGVSFSVSSGLTVSFLFLNSCSNSCNDEEEDITDVIQCNTGSKEETLLNMKVSRLENVSMC